jgi:GTP cyclohydrolase FolE2
MGARVDPKGDKNLLKNIRASLDSLPDVQMQTADVDVRAGVRGFSTVFTGSRWALPVKLSIMVDTKNSRGVHMSRLISATQNRMKGDYIETALTAICKEVDRTQPGCEITAELSYPVRDQFLEVKIIMQKEEEDIQYTFEKVGITACPCSKEITGIGHMQRSRLRIEVASQNTLNFEEVALKMAECFSAEPVEFLKRADEAEKILEAQANPKFVEDIVRDCLERFPTASKIEARSWESIHAHDAVAIWRKEDYDQ